MLSRCDSAAGGQGLRKTKTASQETNNNHIPLSLNTEEDKDQQEVSSSGYTVRLRPRPTRQTEHYRSPTSKRKIPFKELGVSVKRTVSEPVTRTSVAVRPTRTSILREQKLKTGDIQNKKSELHKAQALDSGIPTKRLRSEQPDLPVKTSKSLEQVQTKKTTKKSGKSVKQKSKEVASKLWYPFIPPAASSDSEEDISFQEELGSSSSTTSLPPTKLASRQTKSASNKTKDKSSADPTTSCEGKSQEGKGGARPKVTSSKPGGRFTLGRFSKSDSAVSSDKTALKVNKETKASRSNQEPTESGVRTRSTLTKIPKATKTSKGKATNKRDEEGKAKNRKRYQSPPNHPLYARKTATNNGKTGSCASTSRRGRGKTSSVTSREQEDTPPPPVMSQEADQSPEEAQPGSGAVGSSASDNQGASGGAESAAAGAGGALNTDGDFDEPDMSRLQALLEARGLPSHFFGTLGPRVQQILHRSVNNGTNSKAQQLLQGMQANGDESRQLQSAIEMCQLLVMGNEDTLSGFPIKMVVPALITLLRMEHNFDMMNHACRALTYMMEALPRSSAVVVDAVPVFLEKLQSIQCMDVAEQSLTALEMLSRQHGSSILRANGLSACLLYLDFFSLPAQRNALTVAANCCFVSSSDQRADFSKYYGTSIPLLVQKLTHHDKKCVESVCLCFARLVDNYHNEPSILKVVAENGLLQNFQNILVVTPPLIGSNTFVMVIRTMCLLCSSCPNLAAQLVRNNIAETLRYLLCGTASDSDEIELVPRSPQELYEITSLIGELMPRLPRDDPMFSVDRLLKQSGRGSGGETTATWQWRTDEGVWKSYSRHDNRMIEDSHRNGDPEANLLVQGRVYVLDFNVMQQVNEDTGHARAIRRQPEKKDNNKLLVKTESDSSLTDARVSLVKEDSVVISQFVRSLFTLLYEVYGTSAGSPAVRHKCLRAVQRMVYYAEPELLRDVLRNLSVSSHIASMLSSNDLKVVVGALQMAMILMNKLPDVFEVYFTRQGVTHQVEQLLNPAHKVVGTNQPSPPEAPGTTSSNTSTPVFEGGPSSTDPSPSDPLPGRLSDMLRRKYPPRRSAGKRMSASSLASTPEDSGGAHRTRGRSSASSPTTDRVISPPLTKAKAFAAAMSTYDGTTDTPTGPKSKSSGASGRSSATSFFYNLNPTRWGRSSTSSSVAQPSVLGSPHSIGSVTSHSSTGSGRMSREGLALPILKKMTSVKDTSREKVKVWVREQAKLFLEQYFSVGMTTDSPNDDKSSSVDQRSLLHHLTSIAQALSTCVEMSVACRNLKALCDITSTSDVSSFELQHSGIVTSVLQFLTKESKLNNNDEEELCEMIRNSSKRRSLCIPTPPMTTRRRSKTESSATTQSLNFEETSIHFEGDRPKSAPSEEMKLGQTEKKIRDDAFEADIPSKSDDNPADASQPLFLTSLDRDDRLRNFLNVFTGLPTTDFCEEAISLSEFNNVEPLRNFVQKLTLCVSQMEQFQVKSHDLPSAPGRGSQALSFFARHQLKCQLQRHPDCSMSKQWHGGPVRVDPLALVQAIERYLIARGYGVASSSDAAWEQAARQDVLMLMGDDESEDEIEVDNDEDDDDDDEEDDQPTLSTASATKTESTSNAKKHRLELYVGNYKLPYNMTVYQAVKQFNEEHCRSTSQMMSSDERDTDDEHITIASTGIWKTTHVIRYKLVPDNEVSLSTYQWEEIITQNLPHTFEEKRSTLASTDGNIPVTKRPLNHYLKNKLPDSFMTNDPSKEVLCLTRVIFGLTRYWHTLYTPSILSTDRPLLPISDFVNTKLSAKCSRQLQDPLMIMTGELPSWLSEIAHACPFVLPFDIRQLLFRVVSFDRDRAMQHLLDSGLLSDVNTASSSAGTGSLSQDSNNRFMPKIEKKKCSVKRENLLQQAEKLMADHGHTRSLLEVQYEGEVGTGLGPTLEFYTLVSHELQRSNLSLWRSDDNSNSVDQSHNIEQTSAKKMLKKLSEIVEEEQFNSPVAMETSFVHSPVGLYPLPIGRTSKLGPIAKACSKFRFLGRFFAKAVMDGRLVDVPLSMICYKWFLSQEHTITWLDLEQVDPGMSLTFNKLKRLLHQRLTIEQQQSDEMEEKINAVTMDGCRLEDLGLDFLLPGFPNIELMKSGAKTSLSINNLDKYLNLIAYWTLSEGVRQQLDAMRDGFQSVFPLQAIDYFFPEELDQLFCGARYQPWSERELADSCRTDHGYNHDSETVKTLFRVLSQYDAAEQRAFLQFVTGSPHLPVGGLRSLHPPLTIVRKTCEENMTSDSYLPSVMTCVNYLKLPEYSNESVMRERLQKAAQEGQKSFLLS
nr:E3 ubiquitin-protein ligase TRIP12 [Ciona intestinalis]|eukprot:XP_026689713.1 E3 ubiquitin-protein ligase TRIP12 [Ciona intestinalis]